MMVPVQEFNHLKDYFKGQMTENALLEKAGRLAAEQHLILKDKRIPDSMAIKITKPLASEKRRLVKRIRTGKTGPLTFRGTEEPEGMVDAPVETLLKQIVKEVKKEPKAPDVDDDDIDTGPSTSGVKIKPSTIKKEKKSPKTPISSKPSSSGGIKKAVLSGATKAVLKQAGFDASWVDSFGTRAEEKYSPKSKGAKGKYPKAKKTAAEKLQEGWEPWDYPMKTGLDYDTDDSD